MSLALCTVRVRMDITVSQEQLVFLRVVGFTLQVLQTASAAQQSSNAKSCTVNTTRLMYS